MELSKLLDFSINPDLKSKLKTKDIRSFYTFLLAENIKEQNTLVLKFKKTQNRNR